MQFSFKDVFNRKKESYYNFAFSGQIKRYKKLYRRVLTWAIFGLPKLLSCNFYDTWAKSVFCSVTL